VPIYSEEDARILTRLGLTTRQAKVYLTLARLGKAKIATISSAAKTDRGNVYRTIARLQELNLVEKVITKPTIFEALPIRDGMAMLIECREKEQAEVEVKVKELLKKHEKGSEVVPAQDESQFALVPEGKLTYRKVTEMWSSNQRTHEIIIYWKDFEHQTNLFLDAWKKLLERGVKFRVIIFFQGKEKLPKEIEDLKKKYSQLQIRSTSKPPKSTISIIDGEQAFISLTPSITPSPAPNLWVKNPVMLAIILEYFRIIWRDSKPLI
jgi:sugar-specific transcriptional regulator TrmB